MRSTPTRSRPRGCRKSSRSSPACCGRGTSGSGPEFIPLLRTGRRGGTLLWSEAFTQGFMGMGIAPNPRRRYMMSGEGYTLAARISGQAPADSEPAGSAKKDAEKKDQKPRANFNLIAIADLDMIGEQFFEIRAQPVRDLGPQFRQHHVRPQLRGRSGRRRFVRPAPEEAAAAPHPAGDRGPYRQVLRGARERDQERRGRGAEGAGRRPGGVQQGGRSRPEQSRARRPVQGGAARQPPEGRPAPARREEADDRGPEAGARSATAGPGSSRILARSRTPCGSRPRHCRPCRRSCSASPSGSSGGRARTSGPIRGG